MGRMTHWWIGGVIVAVGFLLLRPHGTSAEVAVSGGDMPGINTFSVIQRGDITASGSGSPVGKRDFENVAGAGTLIFGFKVYAQGANAWCDLYDSTTVPTAANQRAAVIDELKETTDEEIAVQMWPKPYQLKNGLTMSLTGGVCIVYTG